MRSALPATKAPKLPKALPSVPTRAGTSAADRPKCSSDAAPGVADHAEPVRVVDGEEGAVPAAGRGERRQRREVAVHAEDAVGQDDRAPGFLRGELRLEGLDVAVRIMMQRRARQPAAVDQRGVVQAIAVDRRLARGERRDQAEVRHVAGREQDRPLAPGPGGEFLLERLVLRLVAGDQVRGAGADAVHARRGDESLDDPRMRGEAEVVVAAEVHAGPAVEHDVGGVRVAAAHRAPLPAQAAGIEVRERRPEGDRCDRHRPQPLAGAGSGRMPSRPNRASSLAVSGLPVVRSFSP